jgi:hypothetical protein
VSELRIDNGNTFVFCSGNYVSRPRFSWVITNGPIPAACCIPAFARAIIRANASVIPTALMAYRNRAQQCFELLNALLDTAIEMFREDKEPVRAQ